MTGRPCIVVVGSATRDIAPDDPRGWRIGGGATYGALAAARLGMSTAGFIGVDHLAADAWELKVLRDAGVDLRLVPLEHGPIFNNVEHPEGRVQTCMDPGEPLTTARFPDEWRAAPGWILAPVASELPDAWAEIPPAPARVALGWQGILRTLRGGERVQRLAPHASPLLARANLVGVSQFDIAHDVTLDELCSYLRPGAELLLTCGELGGFRVLLDPAGTRAIHRYSAVPAASTVDPTGAGDVFLAAVLASQLASDGGSSGGAHPGDRVARLETRGLRVAAAAACLVVEGPGVFSVPELRVVRQRLAAVTASRSG